MNEILFMICKDRLTRRSWKSSTDAAEPELEELAPAFQL